MKKFNVSILFILMAGLLSVMLACSNPTSSDSSSSTTSDTGTSTGTTTDYTIPTISTNGFTANFESDTLGSTLPSGFYSGAFADAAVVASIDGYPTKDAQSVQLGDISSSSNSKLVRILDGGTSTSNATLFTEGTVKFAAYLDAECGVDNSGETFAEENLYLTLYTTGTSSTNRYIDIRLDAANLILQRRDVTGTLVNIDGATLTREEWHDIQINWNATQYVVVLDGTEYGPYDVIQSGGVGNAYFKFGQSALTTTAKAYVDNIEIYHN